jgi:hypothetical protein
MADADAILKEAADYAAEIGVLLPSTLQQRAA